VSAYFVPISQWPNYFDKKEKYVPQVNHWAHRKTVHPDMDMRTMC
jgi:hypothetical protein